MTKPSDNFIKLKKMLDEKPYNEFTETQRIDFIKYYVFDILLKLLEQYSLRNDETFNIIFKDVSDKILSASSCEDIDVSLVFLSDYCMKWQPSCYVLKGLKKEFQQFANHLETIKRTIYHFDYFFQFGLLLAPNLIQEITPLQAGSQIYTHGLPDSIMEKLQETPLFCIVYVSGAAFNPYGHTLLFLGEPGFIHIDGIFSRPKHLTIGQFNQYLIDNQKHIIGFEHIPLPHSIKAIQALNESVKNKWNWRLVKHNCITWCWKILEAGGYNHKSDYRLRWELPKNYLDNTKDEYLFPNDCSEEMVYKNMLQNMKLTHIPLAHFQPRELLEFILFVISHYDDVITWQSQLIKQKKILFAIGRLFHPHEDITAKLNHSLQKMIAHIIPTLYNPHSAHLITPTIKDQLNTFMERNNNNANLQFNC